MQRWVLGLLLAVSTVSAYAQPLTGWSKYKDITGDGTAVASGTHTDVVLPIHLSADADIRAGMQSDGRDIRFTSLDNSVTYPHELMPAGHLLMVDGCRTWFSSPQAVYNATANKTWVVAISGGRYVKVCEIDHATNTSQTYRITQLTEEDDHDNGAIVVRSDGRLIFFYGLHSDAASLKWAISDNPYDASAWTIQPPLDPNVVATEPGEYSYSNLLRLTGEGTGVGRIYNFYRFNSVSGDRRWCYIYSDDDGASWSSAQELWSGTSSGTPYIVVSGNGVDRIDIAGTASHPNDGATNRHVCHFYMTGGNFHKTDGTTISAANLPFDTDDATLVYYNASHKAWLDQITFDGINPRILFKVYPNGDNTDHRYYYGVWDGTDWDRKTDIVGAHVGTTPDSTNFDEAYDGCACFDLDDPDIVLCGVMVSGTYEMQRYETTDGGVSFTKIEDVTTGSAADNFRPFITEGTLGLRGRETWLCCGNYTSYADFDTAICCNPPLDHHAAWAYVKIDTITGGEDVDLRVHYGNPDAVDGQNITDTWSDYDVVVHGLPKLNQHKNNIATKGTFNITDRIRGEIWNEAPGAQGLNLNRDTGDTSQRGDITGLNMAGWDAFTVEAWWRCDTSATGRQYLMTNWTGASASGILWRKSNTATTYDAFTSLEPNTQIPASGVMLGTGMNIPDDTPFYAAFVGRQAGTGASDSWSHWVQQNTTQSDPRTSTSTGNLDSTATAIDLGVGNLISGSSDYLRGAVAEIRIAPNFHSKDLRDTQYAFADGETEWTFGAESGGEPALTSSPPTLVSKTNTTVTISWEDATGGTPPYSYSIQARAPPETEWTTVASDVTSPYTVTGLDPETNYDFRLQVSDSAP